MKTISIKDYYGLIASTLWILDPIINIFMFRPYVFFNTVFTNIDSYITLLTFWILSIVLSIVILTKKYKYIKYCMLVFLVYSIWVFLVENPNAENILNIFRYVIYIIWIYRSRNRKTNDTNINNVSFAINNMKIIGMIIFVVMLYVEKYYFMIIINSRDIYDKISMAILLLNEIGYLFFSFYLDELRIKRIEL